MKRPPRLIRRTILLIAASLVCGCESQTGPEFDGTRLSPFAAPANFALWWKLVEECSGRSGDLSSVRWYQTDRKEPIWRNDKSYDGYWWSDVNRIAVQDVMDGSIVRHEMLHALLKDGTHPLGMFAERCDGVVSFDPPDGFGATDRDTLQAAVLDPTKALTVSVGLYGEANPSRYNGAIVVEVTARNLAKSGWMELPLGVRASVGLPNDGPSAGFRTAATRLFFRAGQSRRVLIDWFVAPSTNLTMLGRFGLAESPLTTFAIP